MHVVPDAGLWELERRLVDFVQFITIFLVYFVSIVSSEFKFLVGLVVRVRWGIDARYDVRG